MRVTGLPILFLDVDGPLLPFGDGVPGTPGLARLDPIHGPWLAALPCELMWATTWMDEANTHLVTLAAGRPFAWVDDELTDADYLELDTWLRAYDDTGTRGRGVHIV